MTNAKDYVVIVFGLLLYAFAFCALILPHEIVIGGVAGIGTLVLFATNGLIPVAVTSYVVNLLLLAAAYKIVGKTFVLRTIFGVTVVAIGIGFFESMFMSIGHPLVPDRVVSVALGGILCGVGIGTTFIHNGSSGGTDIVAAMVAKKSNVSIGRTMIFVDMTIVSMSIFLPFTGTMVYSSSLWRSTPSRASHTARSQALAHPDFAFRTAPTAMASVPSSHSRRQLSTTMALSCSAASRSTMPR